MQPKRKTSALMHLFFQIGLIYLTGGLTASVVSGSIRPLAVTAAGTGLLYRFFNKLDSMVPSVA